MGKLISDDDSTLDNSYMQELLFSTFVTTACMYHIFNVLLNTMLWVASWLA